MILIRAGRVLGPAEGLDLKVDAVSDGDGIAGVSPVDQGGAERVPGSGPQERTYQQIIEAEGLVAAPGLVDVHVHFRDPGPTYREDIHIGARATAEGGLTMAVCMANMNPIMDNGKTLRYVLEERKKTGIRVLSCAAMSGGFAGKELTDMEGFLTAGTTGFTGDGTPLMDGVFVGAAMEGAARLDTVLGFHEEDKYFIREDGANHGGISGELGIYGFPALTGDSLMARDCMIALDTGATVDIQHIGPGHPVEVARLAKRSGVKVWVEATPHHFTLTEETVLEHGTLAKMDPPLRTEKDRQTLTEGLKGGTIDMIATDHAPRSKEGKGRPLTQAPSGILGLETALTLGIINLVKAGHLTLLELMEKMNLNLARLHKLDCGYTGPGAPADLVLFGVNRQQAAEGFESRSANNPFLGGTLAGKIIYTVCEGKVVYGEQGTEI